MAPTSWGWCLERTWEPAGRAEVTNSGCCLFSSWRREDSDAGACLQIMSIFVSYSAHPSFPPILSHSTDQVFTFWIIVEYISTLNFIYSLLSPQLLDPSFVLYLIFHFERTLQVLVFIFKRDPLLIFATFHFAPIRYWGRGIFMCLLPRIYLHSFVSFS